MDCCADLPEPCLIQENTRNTMSDPRINCTPEGFDPRVGLPRGFLDFILPFHGELIPRQHELIAKRSEVLAQVQLATDRIYRLMIAQHIPQKGAIEIVDRNGHSVKHTPELANKLFYHEELDHILAELTPGTDTDTVEKYRQARRMSKDMISRKEFNPI